MSIKGITQLRGGTDVRYANPRIVAALTCACLMVAGPTAAVASADPGTGHGHGKGPRPAPAAAAPGINDDSQGGAGGSSPSGTTAGAGPGSTISSGSAGTGSSSGGKISSGNGGAGNNGSFGKVPATPPSWAALKPPKIGSSGGSNSGNNGSRQINIPQPAGTAGDLPAAVTSVPQPELISVSVRLPVEVTAVTPVQPMAILVARQADSGTSTDGDGLSMMIRGITPVWAGAQPDGMWESLFVGLIGVVLMPLAGLWIGYQQIRAERATGNITGI